MKFDSFAVVGLAMAAVVSAAVRPDQTVLSNYDQDLYLVELGPGETRVRHFSGYIFLSEAAS